MKVLLRLAAGIAVVLAVSRLLAAPAMGVPRMRTLPGAAPYPAALRGELARALAAKGRSYKPHTAHLNADGSPKYVNRLIRESSPYLLQHAHNPVNWYPWGDEAFERARREKKPVLLSVGYSTCHWCHVMEEESFEDLEIATFINAHYVAIKVDRERRPDVDGIYMAAVRLLSGRGGWPMTVWLTPDRKPFYGGTYFPARDGDRGARVGFLTLLRRLDQLYRKQPDQVASRSGEIAARLRQSLAAAPGQGLPTAAVLRKAYGHYRGAFDERDGGFGRAPKFPRSVELEFLLRYHRRAGDAQALRMVERTLEAMAAGGMYDQVGGGFHRYSTDAHWLVPHFEKMLYDNALLAVAYLEAYQATERPEFARVAREILAYVEREMTDARGGFYSATDADSDGEEGKFFVWTPAELAALLTPEQRRLATAYYGVTERGNFEGKNILHIARPLSDVAAELGLASAKADALLRDVRGQLYEARKKRVPPHTDRKILTSWNGLMISAFARAAQVFGESSYARAASRAAEFLLTKMTRGERLRRSDLDGQVSGEGFLEDYAFLTAGLLDLYEATFDPRWMRRAVALQKVLDEHFVDGGGGYFLTSDDHEKLLAREKPSYDGAEPSGNSVALQNLLRLYEFTGGEPYRKRAERALRGFQPTLAKYPSSVPKMLTAVDFWLEGAKEIVIVTPGADHGSEADPFLSRLRGAFLPNRVVAVVSAGRAQQDLAKTVPLVAGKPARGGRPTAYVCERQVCDLPTTDPAVFARQIAKVRALQ